jgi:hypothetical protein
LAAKTREFCFFSEKILFFFVASFLVFCDQKERGLTRRRHSQKARSLFFSFLFAPHNKHTRVRVLFCALCSNQIERKNGILRVRIDISGSLSGFEYCGENEECGTKSSIVIDACLDESDSVD